MMQRRSVGRRLALWAIVLLGTVWLVSLVAVVVWGRRDSARPAAAIVVMGAAQYAGRPSPVFRARLDHAVDLWRRGLAPRLILTGGMGEGDTTSEAAVGRRYVLKHGIPDSAILLESHGRTTRQSLEAVARLVDSLPDRSVILVSDPFHMLRLSILSERLELEAVPSPTRTSPISANPGESFRYVVGESVKVPFVLLLSRSET